MSDGFDPYRKWLGIRTPERPLNHYQLLGLEPFEDHDETISHAVDQRMAYVRTLSLGDYAEITQRVLNELAAARICLLNPDSKAAYDAQLRFVQNGAAARPVRTAERPSVGPRPAMVVEPQIAVGEPVQPLVDESKPVAETEPTRLIPDFPTWTSAAPVPSRPASRRLRNANSNHTRLRWSALGGIVAVTLLVVVGVKMVVWNEHGERALVDSPTKLDPNPTSPEPNSKSGSSNSLLENEAPTDKMESGKPVAPDSDPNAKAVDSRSTWLNELYHTTVRRKEDGKWEEIESRTAKVLHGDEVEVIRTDEYVEIRCPERDAHIRLFDDRMEALNSKTGNWENVAHGRWVFELTAHGRPLDVGKHAVTRLVDWNRDGKLDLLVGAGDGYVWIFRNVGSPTEFRLAPGEHVKDGRDDLRAGDGFTTACFVDLTGDGKADLLVAHSEDQIRLYVNRGTAALPAFNGYTGIPGLNGADLQLEKDCGARIDVGVWDGDGLPDM